VRSRSPAKSEKAFAIAAWLALKTVELVFAKINPNLEDACVKQHQY
jgi:hypothetical protein